MLAYRQHAPLYPSPISVNGRSPAVTPARKNSVMFIIGCTDTSWNMPLTK